MIRISWSRASVIRPLVSILDQMVLSLSSLGLVIVTARLATISEFATFALAHAALVAMIGGIRVVLGNALIFDMGRKGAGRTSDAALAGGMLIALGVGLAVGIPLSLSALAGPNWLSPILLSAAVAGPGLCVVEALRAGHYACHTPWRAAVLSAGVLILSGSFLLWVSVTSRVWWHPLAAWGLAFDVVALLALLQRRPWRFPRAVGRLVHAQDIMWRARFGHYAAASGTQLAVPYLVALGGGPSAVAGLRAAQTLVGFPMQIPQGLQPWLAANATRAYSETLSPPVTLLRAWHFGQLVIVSLAYGAILLLPPGMGPVLLGETWYLAREVLPVALVGALLIQMAAGVEILARAMGDALSPALVRTVMILPTIGAAWTGAVLGGATGAAYGLALSNAFVLTLLSGRYLRRQHINLRRCENRAG